MNLDNLNRTVQLHCPSCGNTNLESLAGTEEATELFKCPSCGYEMTKDELLKGNSENVEVNVEEITKEAVEEIKKQMSKQLRDAFKNNKHIKFK